MQPVRLTNLLPRVTAARHHNPRRLFVTEQSRKREEFNYVLYRSLAKKAYVEARQVIGRPIEKATSGDIIVPFGFELFGIRHLQHSSSEPKPFWPQWPFRLYPALRAPEGMNRAEADNFGMAFAGAFFRSADSYPELAHRLQYAEVHGNGSTFRGKIDPDTLSCINTMHIEVFQTEDILLHYANYVACLFGALTANNKSVPEMREFDDSKTRRNRLFQLFIMANTLAESTLPELPDLTPSQRALLGEVYGQLRKQNPSEMVQVVKTQPVAVTGLEIQIRDELILLRLGAIRTVLDTIPGQRDQMSSPPYYNGEAPLIAHLPCSFSRKAIPLVRKSYEEFPRLFAEHDQKATTAPSPGKC